MKEDMQLSAVLASALHLKVLQLRRAQKKCPELDDCVQSWTTTHGIRLAYKLILDWGTLIEC